MGRPAIYTEELAAAICQRLADGESLRAVCDGEEMPAESTVRLWALENREGFSAQYTRARELGYLAMADELLDIADDGVNDYVEKTRPDGSKYEAFDAEHVQRSRLRVDTRKWMLSKVLPKVYGDKITQEHTGEGGGPVQFVTIYEDKK